ncbi:MAG: class II aldolase/adducin family protein [Betaproteobacteria bacterium]|nr:class II aldolase/adducin family protein [Betaproteobacteria bacterium]
MSTGITNIAAKRSTDRRSQVSAEEWKARQDLACAYRLFDHLGWHGLIFNHITLRVPGEDSHFLINPFGLMYREVTASNLVKIDTEGNIVGDSDHPVNRAGFVIHSAVHMTRHDAHAVMHTHTKEGVAVAAQEEGLLPLSMPAIGMQGYIAYHEYEGISLDTGERERLIRDLGDKNVLILRNHGLLTCGKTLAECFMRMRSLQAACEIQVAAMAGGAKLHIPESSSLAHTYQKQLEAGNTTATHAKKDAGESVGAAELMWGAMTRWMTDKDPRFLD